GARGEVTIAVAGAAAQSRPAPALDDAELGVRVAALAAQGLGAKQIAAQLAAETGLAKRALYERAVSALAARRAGSARPPRP
ncbi:MAG: 16S rRNA (cytidine(1402)-2'-O)-methyltransferase, partial [Proteobacteria bacterium]